MSRWRQEGFVLDSDEEEEESQIESQSTGKDSGNRRVGRVNRDGKENAKEDTKDTIGEKAAEVEDSSFSATPRISTAPERPPISPSPQKLEHEPPESPDPIQISPSRILSNSKTSSTPAQSSQTPVLLPTTVDEQADLDNVAPLKGLEDVALPSQRPAATSSEKLASIPLDVLGAFGIAPLSDDSDNESLSEPPTDIESPPPMFTTPHRRTAVQVVIPSSTALQHHIAEMETTREFRQRKPIQLHPYALEGELYRREVQSRGLKPVPRQRSPQRQELLEDAESQEQDFNPHRTPSSSPPELSIPVATPAVPRLPKNPAEQRSSRRSEPGLLRRPASTQLRLPKAVKKRRLNISLTQDTPNPVSIFEDLAEQRDVWSIPPNSPPYSSSPRVDRNRTASGRKEPPASIFPNLPTPSTSSIFQDEPQVVVDSDSDAIPRSIQRPSSDLRQPTRIIISDSSSSASDSASEAEQSDQELRKVGKKIKGVLPASWLRFDRLAQERRKRQQREDERSRLEAITNSETTEPQRGVAQKVTRPSARSRPVSSREAGFVSDAADDESNQSQFPPVHKEHISADDARAVAAMLDSRYADDNSSDMENDRLDLPTLGGTGTKRKKQTRLTDVFEKAKRAKLSSTISRGGKSRKHSSRSINKPTNSRLARHGSPPAMSIVDVDISPTKASGSVPQFLRIAKRQALRRPDLARQSPNTKQIRLHNAHDTVDANITLEQWYQGSLKPKVVGALTRSKPRSPLTARTDNHQPGQPPEQPQSRETESVPKGIKSSYKTSSPRMQRQASIPLGLHIFKRAQQGTKRKQISTAPATLGPKRKILSRNEAHPFRVAQLEGDETDFSRGHRKIAFEKGLHRVEQNFAAPLNQSLQENPLLARFLADNDIALPSLPSAEDIQELDSNTPKNHARKPKKRLIRKAEARRIDVDTREYRQPNEPAVADILNTAPVSILSPESEVQEAVLQGLGPYGTRYPTTFDVFPLATDTYFNSSTFVGSDELQRALCTGKWDARNLDEPSGYYTLSFNTLSFRCGPWNDETCSRLQDIIHSIWMPLDCQTLATDNLIHLHQEAVSHLANFVRSLITYVSAHLSFLDPIDRADFVSKMLPFIHKIFDQLVTAHDASDGSSADSSRKITRVMAYLLVMSAQVHQIAQHPTIATERQVHVGTLIRKIANNIIKELLHHGISDLTTFLETNKQHAVRLQGVQESEIFVESVLISMHVLDDLSIQGLSFWDIVSSELSTAPTHATHVQSFEVMWATLYTLLPFIELDVSGIPIRNRRVEFQSGNWGCVRTVLKRLFELYPSTSKRHSSSLNDYVRANLARCHRLIHQWHWRRPEHMLNVVFDFFGKNGLQQLQREESRGSAPFLENLATEPDLALLPNENSFHTALKCVALGLQGMQQLYPEKKIRSFVFRTIPNHGRAYPKDQPLDEESLAALRNHHDLLATLYWAAPPSCRPKLDHIRELVNHENSHREACRVNVRAWANLAAFQVSTDEPYTSTKPIALWHKDIMHQTLKQYWNAKIEADDYLKSGALDGSAEMSAELVRQTMGRNQEQVIATLRDCIAGMKKAIHCAKDQATLRSFVLDSDMVYLLELPHLEDRRLVTVTKDVLSVLREYVTAQRRLVKEETSQQTSEESQEYGAFPDLDELEDIDGQTTNEKAQLSILDFIQTSLWHHLSNVFGAETSPDENLLMDSVDTWVDIAEDQVASGEKSWSHYMDSFSQVSWQQLRHTEQTRKYSPFFMASLIDRDPAAYDEHSQEFMTALLVCLVDRESMLRFQYRLLQSIVQRKGGHPLLSNIPFFCDTQTGTWDITNDTLRSRRLALLSSILSNMRDDVNTVTLADSTQAASVKRMYASMLKDLMTAMKSNYQQLRQGSTVTGAYVEFVQNIVQFLTQYTSDICPVIPFFTDSVAFPLPAADPTYVVGRLCGYAPKLNDLGTAKQLSVFIQTVAQQAAADNQQAYLVNQLTRALCTDEAPHTDGASLRSVLLQGIFPAYVEESFSTATVFNIARPILQALPLIFETMMFDLRVTQQSSLSSIVSCIASISHAFVRGTEYLKANSGLLQQPHTLSALSYLLEAMRSTLPLLEYICSRTISSVYARKPALVAYVEQMSIYTAEMIHNMVPNEIPTFEGEADAAPKSKLHDDLLTFSRKGLRENLKANWSEHDGRIWFGQGQARREIILDVGLFEEERVRLIAVIEALHGTTRELYGEEQYHAGGRMDIEHDFIV
ncbi:hypothetical protein IQ07DRAFT_587763 [Pyrenochaeta sp. DS3sAY3a]|nr:hypothetical protein IQ07DRAFT_587763 [Pyrenochaeta sp. DS3sAY3a]